jgi:hypothetical protein
MLRLTVSVDTRASLLSTPSPIVPGFQVENPITHARARFELDQHATPEMKALADEVATITAKLKSLETLVVFNNQLAEARPSILQGVGSFFSEADIKEQ